MLFPMGYFRKNAANKLDSSSYYFLSDQIYILIWLHNKTKITVRNINLWLNLFISNVFVSGLLWGSAAIILIPYGTGQLVEFTLYNSFVMLTVCGLVAGAVVSYSISYRVILAYATPALLPPALYMISLGDKYNSGLGGFVILFYIFIFISSFRLNKQFRHYVDIEYQRQKLLLENKALINKIKEIREKTTGDDTTG